MEKSTAPSGHWVDGAKEGSFIKGQCYRMAVQFFAGYEVSDSEGYAQYLTYELVRPDAYERLTDQEYWQYRQ